MSSHVVKFDCHLSSLKSFESLINPLRSCEQNVIRKTSNSSHDSSFTFNSMLLLYVLPINMLHAYDDIEYDGEERREHVSIRLTFISIWILFSAIIAALTENNDIKWEFLKVKNVVENVSPNGNKNSNWTLTNWLTGKFYHETSSWL